MPYYPAMELGGLEIAGVYQGVYSLTLSGLAMWLYLFAGGIEKTKWGNTSICYL